MAASRGYSATKKQLLGGLGRAEARSAASRGWSRRTYCLDVLTQIAAAQAALDKIALGLLDDHTPPLRLLGDGGGPSEPEAQADEIMAAVRAFRGSERSEGGAMTPK